MAPVQPGMEQQASYDPWARIKAARTLDQLRGGPARTQLGGLRGSGEEREGRGLLKLSSPTGPESPSALTTFPFLSKVAKLENSKDQPRVSAAGEGGLLEHVKEVPWTLYGKDAWPDANTGYWRQRKDGKGKTTSKIADSTFWCKKCKKPRRSCGCCEEKQSAAAPALPARMIGKLVPLTGSRREHFTPEEEKEVAKGEQQLIEPLLQTDATPMSQMLASPDKQGLLGGLLGGGLGAAAGGGLGYLLGHPGIGAGIGGGLGAVLTGGAAADSRWRRNEHMKEMMRRLEPGATKRDYAGQQMLLNSLENRFGGEEKMSSVKVALDPNGQPSMIRTDPHTDQVQSSSTPQNLPVSLKRLSSGYVDHNFTQSGLTKTNTAKQAGLSELLEKILGHISKGGEQLLGKTPELATAGAAAAHDATSIQPRFLDRGLLMGRHVMDMGHLSKTGSILDDIYQAFGELFDEARGEKQAGLGALGAGAGGVAGSLLSALPAGMSMYGGATAPQGYGMQGAMGGAARGAGTAVGGGLGGVGGAAGALLLARALGLPADSSALAPMAMAGGGLGAAAGGYGGYKLMDKLLPNPGLDKKKKEEREVEKTSAREDIRTVEPANAHTFGDYTCAKCKKTFVTQKHCPHCGGQTKKAGLADLDLNGIKDKLVNAYGGLSDTQKAMVMGGGIGAGAGLLSVAPTGVKRGLIGGAAGVGAGYALSQPEVQEQIKRLLGSVKTADMSPSGPPMAPGANMSQMGQSTLGNGMPHPAGASAPGGLAGDATKELGRQMPVQVHALGRADPLTSVMGRFSPGNLLADRAKRYVASNVKPQGYGGEAMSSLLPTPSNLYHGIFDQPKDFNACGDPNHPEQGMTRESMEARQEILHKSMLGGVPVGGGRKEYWSQPEMKQQSASQMEMKGTQDGLHPTVHLNDPADAAKIFPQQITRPGGAALGGGPQPTEGYFQYPMGHGASWLPDAPATDANAAQTGTVKNVWNFKPGQGDGKAGGKDSYGGQSSGSRNLMESYGLDNNPWFQEQKATMTPAGPNNPNHVMNVSYPGGQPAAKPAPAAAPPIQPFPTSTVAGGQATPSTPGAPPASAPSNPAAPSNMSYQNLPANARARYEQNRAAGKTNMTPEQAASFYQQHYAKDQAAQQKMKPIWDSAMAQQAKPSNPVAGPLPQVGQSKGASLGRLVSRMKQGDEADPLNILDQRFSALPMMGQEGRQSLNAGFQHQNNAPIAFAEGQQQHAQSAALDAPPQIEPVAPKMAFAIGFANKCQAMGMSREEIHKMAEAASQLDPAIAEDLEPITKQAGIGQLIGKVISSLAQHSGQLAGRAGAAMAEHSSPLIQRMGKAIGSEAGQDVARGAAHMLGNTAVGYGGGAAVDAGAGALGYDTHGMGRNIGMAGGAFHGLHGVAMGQLDRGLAQGMGKAEQGMAGAAEHAAPLHGPEGPNSFTAKTFNRSTGKYEGGKPQTYGSSQTPQDRGFSNTFHKQAGGIGGLIGKGIAALVEHAAPLMKGVGSAAGRIAEEGIGKAPLRAGISMMSRPAEGLLERGGNIGKGLGLMGHGLLQGGEELGEGHMATWGSDIAGKMKNQGLLGQVGSHAMAGGIGALEGSGLGGLTEDAGVSPDGWGTALGAIGGGLAGAFNPKLLANKNLAVLRNAGLRSGMGGLMGEAASQTGQLAGFKTPDLARAGRLIGAGSAIPGVSRAAGQLGEETLGRAGRALQAPAARVEEEAALAAKQLPGMNEGMGEQWMNQTGHGPALEEAAAAKPNILQQGLASAGEAMQKAPGMIGKGINAATEFTTPKLIGGMGVGAIAGMGNMYRQGFQAVQSHVGEIANKLGIPTTDQNGQPLGIAEIGHQLTQSAEGVQHLREQATQLAKNSMPATAFGPDGQLTMQGLTQFASQKMSQLQQFGGDGIVGQVMQWFGNMDGTQKMLMLSAIVPLLLGMFTGNTGMGALGSMGLLAGSVAEPYLRNMMGGGGGGESPSLASHQSPGFQPAAPAAQPAPAAA